MTFLAHFSMPPMRINGTLAELMAKTDPKLYRKYLTDEKGKKVL